jgi:hypothetical protein
VAAPSNGLEAEIERLYGLPLDQFTPARDELARRLRREGDREGAAAITALRKPSVAAWALNQVQRSDRASVERLIAAGEALRDAQQRLLSAGEQGALRSAAAAERAAAGELAAAALHELAAGGHAASAATEQKIATTLRAVASDPGVRELLRAGKLVRDYEVSDLGLGGLEGVGAVRRGELGSGAGARGKASPDAGKVRALEQRIERAREKRSAAEERVGEAERTADAARRDAARAAKERERAEAALARARAARDESAERLRSLERELAQL